MPNHALLDADDSILAVIDVQNNFTAKLTPEQSRRLLERISWLVHVAAWLNIPMLVTVEDLPKAGGPSSEVLAALPPHTPIYNKLIFGLADQPDLLTHLEKTGRKTAVLVGLETDVCIAHSALGLLARGYRVAVIADATGSPGESHAAGLARLRDAGILITDTKGLFYEWTRTVERARQFDADHPHLTLPTGLVL